MPSYKLSLEARNDLAEVWLYLAEYGNDAIADHFIKNLELVCAKISKMPNMGSPQDHIKSGLRKHAYKSYSIYYDSIEPGHIVIRRFWHQSRDLDNLSMQ